MDNPIVCPNSPQRKFCQRAPGDKKTCGCICGVPSVVAQILTIKEDTGSAASQHKYGNGISARGQRLEGGVLSPLAADLPPIGRKEGRRPLTSHCLCGADGKHADFPGRPRRL